MSNPYVPPTQEPAIVPQPPSETGPIDYIGGWWGVLALGVGSGVLTGMMVSLSLEGDTLAVAFGTPALVWIGTFVTLLKMLRGVHITASMTCLIAFLLSVPAYILYVPVCTFSSMLAGDYFGTRNYAPFPSSVIVCSVVSTLGILLMVAVLVRSRTRIVADRPSRL